MAEKIFGVNNFRNSLANGIGEPTLFEFELLKYPDTIKDKFKAPTAEYGEEVLMVEDPKELFPFVNELAYSVTISGNNQMSACYWIEWIIEYENRCKALKEKIFCERRNFAKVDSKCQKDIVWVIWDVFLKESSKRSKIIQKLMDALMALFCLKYTIHFSKPSGVIAKLLFQLNSFFCSKGSTLCNIKT